MLHNVTYATGDPSCLKHGDLVQFGTDSQAEIEVNALDDGSTSCFGVHVVDRNLLTCHMHVECARGALDLLT